MQQPRRFDKATAERTIELTERHRRAFASAAWQPANLTNRKVRPRRNSPVRHFLGVRLAVMTMSWISSSDTGQSHRDEVAWLPHCRPAARGRRRFRVQGKPHRIDKLIECVDRGWRVLHDQIAGSPAYHPVDRRDWSLLDNTSEKRPMLLVKSSFGGTPGEGMLIRPSATRTRTQRPGKYLTHLLQCDLLSN